VRYTDDPVLSEPSMIAAWPGMGFIAKISADYLRRRLQAKQFAEINYYYNMLVYNNGIGELAPIKHKFFAVPESNLIIVTGDAQPSTPEESMKLALEVIEVAKKYEVKRVYSLAAYPSEHNSEPQVYGICTHDHLKAILENVGVKILTDEGIVNGLNGIVIGVAKNNGIEGICLMGDIKYANVPQHLSSKAVLTKLSSLLKIDLDTTLLEKRARRIDASIKRRLDMYEEDAELTPISEKKLDYIS
jgi:proteasome assembly chaperone (PAC2) family protein